MRSSRAFPAITQARECSGTFPRAAELESGFSFEKGNLQTHRLANPACPHLRCLYEPTAFSVYKIPIFMINSQNSELFGIF